MKFTMKRKTVIVDIDGTIADVSKRVHYLSGDSSEKDWDAFYGACDTDTPIGPVLNLVKKLNFYHRIVFCTGRRETEREKTMEWLKKHYFEIDTDDLLMRKNGDFRHDVFVKPELLAKAKISLDDIAFVLEDRNSMVNHWRKMGLTYLQVAEGDF